MITPTNWPNPEKPGVPLFSERDGWHWLSNRADETPFPAEWSHEDYSDGHTEWSWDMGEEQVDAHEMRSLYYHGPCLSPGTVNETGCTVLNNITTLTERARKNIAVASGARKMAKAILPILAEIDDEVDSARITLAVLTPTQITEILAGERERCAKAAQEVSDEYYERRDAADNDDDRVYADERMCAAQECAEAIRNLGDAP